MELILTLDVGTTSVKACLFDRQLRQTALTSREYALQTRGVCAEVEAQVYLDAAAQCILSLPAEARARVCAVALTTQGETLLCVDRQGKALRPAIVWLDSRGMAVSDGVWMTKLVKPGETVYFQSVAPTRQCRDFILNMKEVEEE